MQKQENELKNKIRVLLAAPGYQPQKPHGIIRNLGIPEGQSRAVRYALRDLETAGELVRLKGNRYALMERGPMFTGKLTMHHQGFGFVLLDENQPKAPKEDVFVPPGQNGLARHGDVVQVELLPDNARGRRRDKGFEGRVVDVLKRGNHRIVGTLQNDSGIWQLIPDDPRYQELIHIHDPSAGVAPEAMNKYVVELNDRGSTEMVETGTLVERLGPVDDAEVDILAIMRTHGLATEFPEPVNREASAFTAGIPDEEIQNRRDLRDLICCTIDPNDARDFDDALTWESLPNGGQRLAVHIADVGYYVRPGTAIDDEARLRGNSAYLVDRVVSMLPTNLTTDLCSLLPHQDRLAHTAIIEFDQNLAVTHRETCHSVIHSNARLTYDEVQTWMDNGEKGGVPSELQERLCGLRQLAKDLRRGRFEKDALTFNVPEVRAVLDEAKEQVIGFEKREGMEAYQLVEECMLVANREVGGMLAARFKHAIFRIHEEPQAKNWEKMEQDLRDLGMGNRPVTRENLNKIVSDDTPEALRLPVTIAILKNLNRARYSERLDEHFGLAFATYSHFTSPIRRYPDLIAHRLLDVLASGEEPPYSPEELRELSLHCSTTERNAEEAEKSTVAVRRLQYYHDKLWEGETGPYPALISGVSPKGLQVELLESQQRGLVPFRSLADDYFEISDSGSSARGQRGKQVYRIGDEINVLLAQVDVKGRLVDFAPAPSSKAKRSRSNKRRRRKGEVRQR